MIRITCQRLNAATTGRGRCITFTQTTTVRCVSTRGQCDEGFQPWCSIQTRSRSSPVAFLSPQQYRSAKSWSIPADASNDNPWAAIDVRAFIPESVSAVDSDSDEAFWWHHASQCERPAAQAMVSRCRVGALLGVGSDQRGVSDRAGSVYHFALASKQKHPRMLLLFRQGDFYEAVGHDAVQLVEHAGLNPMSGADGKADIPKAGCPVQNLRPTLRALTDAGFSVAVGEEVQQPFAIAKSRTAKERYIAGIVTPASPVYLNGYVEVDSDADLTQYQAPPIVGIVASARGYSLMRLNPELREIHIEDGLVEDVAVSKVAACGFAPPLYLHASVKMRSHRPAHSSKVQGSHAGVGIMEAMSQTFSLGQTSFKSFGQVTSDAPAIASFTIAVCNDLGIPPPYLSSNNNDTTTTNNNNNNNNSNNNTATTNNNDSYTSTINTTANMNNNAHDERGQGNGNGSSTWRIINSNNNHDRPNPVSVSAAVQLGLLASPGVPRLVDSLLAGGNSAPPAACRKWMEAMLLAPPRYKVSRQLALAAEELGNQQSSVIKTTPMNAPRVARLLRDEEASAFCFVEIWRMVSRASRALLLDTIEGNTETTTAASRCLYAASDATGLSYDSADNMAILCAHVASQIAKIVVCDIASDHHDSGERVSVMPATSLSQRDVEMVEKLLSRSEDWRGRVRVSATKDAHEKVEAAATHLCRTIDEEFGFVLSGSGNQFEQMQLANPKLRQLGTTTPITSAVRSKKSSVSIIYEARDNALWLSGPVKEKAAQQVGIDIKTLESEKRSIENEIKIAGVHRLAAKDANEMLKHASKEYTLYGQLADISKHIKDHDSQTSVEFIRPKDRWNKTVNDKWSTKRVEDAAHAYRRACYKAKEEITRVLRQLARDIADPTHGSMSSLLLACEFSLIYRSMTEHARMAKMMRWHIPTLLEGGRREISMRGVWPYWLTRDDAVPNDIDLDGMTILTGPNMAGKSTIARVVASVSLLSHCGFFAPCTSATVPELDAICLRMSGGDSPAEGKSGFAVEMIDAKTILRDSTDRTLVLMDEVGRGTEFRAGTAIAAALLENLASRGCTGIFATHLHNLLDLTFETNHEIHRAAMGIRQQGDRLVPTHVFLTGVESRDSLALSVASEQGIPTDVLVRAQHFLSELPGAERPWEGGLGPIHEAQHENLLAIPSEFEVLELLEQISKDTRLSNSAEVSSFIHTADHVLAPSNALQSTVYVLKEKTGFLYVGETDDIVGRIDTHRQNPKWKAADVFCIKVANKSDARKLETATVLRMQNLSWPVVSTKDAAHRNFGASQ